MKKFILAASVSLLASVSLHAGILYWQVDTADLASNSGISESSSYTYAAIREYSDGPALQTTIVGGSSTELAPSVEVDALARYASEIGSDYTTKYYFIELYDADGFATYKSGKISGESLMNMVDSQATFNQNFGTMNSSFMVNSTTGGGYSPVPEPTSGLLMLLGAAMLGLRRRKVA